MYLCISGRFVNECFLKLKTLAVFGFEPSSNFLQILVDMNVLIFNTAGIFMKYPLFANTEVKSPIQKLRVS